MSFYAVGGPDEQGNKGRLIVLDMPGYGKGSREEWGKEIMKYLRGRRQLRRVFLLVDAEHGVKRNDEELLRLMREEAISHQVVLSKVDKIVMPKGSSGVPARRHLEEKGEVMRKVCEDVRKKVQPMERRGPEALGEILACSAEKGVEPGKRLGVDELRWAVMAACGLTGRRQRLGKGDLQVLEEEGNG